jgi:hypothetical protein
MLNSVFHAGEPMPGTPVVKRKGANEASFRQYIQKHQKIRERKMETARNTRKESPPCLCFVVSHAFDLDFRSSLSFFSSSFLFFLFFVVVFFLGSFSFLGFFFLALFFLFFSASFRYRRSVGKRPDARPASPSQRSPTSRRRIVAGTSINDDDEGAVADSEDGLDGAKHWQKSSSPVANSAGLLPAIVAPSIVVSQPSSENLAVTAAAAAAAAADARPAVPPSMARDLEEEEEDMADEPRPTTTASATAVATAAAAATSSPSLALQGIEVAETDTDSAAPVPTVRPGNEEGKKPTKQSSFLNFVHDSLLFFSFHPRSSCTSPRGPICPCWTRRRLTPRASTSPPRHRQRAQTTLTMTRWCRETNLPYFSFHIHMYNQFTQTPKPH